ncbi:MAG: Fur family transcriptional regulator [Pseudomonadota bacterium]
MSSEHVAFETHEHTGCVAKGVSAAEAICAERSVRLTDSRRRVLEILLADHKALGAYEVLSQISERGEPAHPPAAYRALDFLVENGLAHRIERLNAFIACSAPRTGHRPAFLICRDCRSVAEAQIDPDEGVLGETAARIGFQIEQTSIEVEGLCPACQPAQS